MKRSISAIFISALSMTFCQAQIIDSDTLPLPIFTENSVETCLNSRYSQHSLYGTASIHQISNIVWAAGKAPFIGSQRDIYVLTPTATYLYDPDNHALNWYSNEARDDGAFAIRYESELDFDTGVSFMPALLAAVSLCNSTESTVATCPKGIGYPKARLIFGVQPVSAMKTELAVHCSVPEGETGWLPEPTTSGDNSLDEVLANLNYVSNFSQENLTLKQISQILWAGYGCTPHTPSGKAGLTVPSAWANYYLTRSIYLVNENGVFRYHNRNPVTNLSTRDHRIELLSPSDGRGRQPVDDGDSSQSVDVRDALRSTISGLPEVPCYVILCLDSSYAGQEYPSLEVGFVAGSMLIQATAIDLGCHFTSTLTSEQQTGIQAATNIPASHVPQAIVSIGPIEILVTISVALQGNDCPDTGWVVPLTVKFFTPGTDVLNDVPDYEFYITTTKSATGDTVFCEATGIPPGTYDITVTGESTLTNIKRYVVISAPNTSVDMGTLLEGNANRDDIINLDDFAILSKYWLASKVKGEYDTRADFDHNNIINITDLYLLASNWLKGSPIEITP
jgi:hypothetical protein